MRAASANPARLPRVRLRRLGSRPPPRRAAAWRPRAPTRPAPAPRAWRRDAARLRAPLHRRASRHLPLRRSSGGWPRPPNGAPRAPPRRRRSAPSVAQGLALGRLAPAVRLQHERASPCDQRVVLLGMLRLQCETSDLRLELGDQVGDTGQVVARPASRASASFLRTCRFLTPAASSNSCRRSSGRSDSAESTVPCPTTTTHWRPAAPRQQLDHVAQPRPRPVDEVLALARSGTHAGRSTPR